MITKKAIGPVIAITLILITGVVSAFYVQNWYSSYESKSFSSATQIIGQNSVELTYVDSSNLYIRNYNSININVTNIKIDSTLCGISNNIIGSSGIYSINISSCTQGMLTGPKQVFVYTNSGVFSKTLNFVQLYPNLAANGSFTGYAYGEHIGFIKFNGTGYQVKISNNVIYGNAYSENYGYISFNGTGYQVLVDGAGVLSGYAYGEQLGYISFNGNPFYSASISGSNLQGYAYSENYGFIHFNNIGYYQVTFSNP